MRHGPDLWAFSPAKEDRQGPLFHHLRNSDSWQTPAVMDRRMRRGRDHLVRFNRKSYKLQQHYLILDVLLLVCKQMSKHATKIKVALDNWLTIL